MVTSFGSMNVYADAEMGYRRERIQQDFAAVNWAAQQRADRRARAAEVRAAGRPGPISAPARRLTWNARWHRTPRPATH